MPFGSGEWPITAIAEDNNGVRSYSMILFPQSDANLTFRAYIGGQRYEAALTPALESGYVYTYHITVKNRELSVSGCTIRDWNTDTEYNGETEVVIPPIGDKAMELADVGDYYFSDGTFADKDAELTAKQANACIGIVFHKGQHSLDHCNYMYTGIGQQKCHGYVVALTDARDNIWNIYGYQQPTEGLCQMDWEAFYHTAVFYNDSDTFLVGKSCEEYGSVDNGRYAAPANSCGRWLCPTPLQLSDLFSNRELLSVQMYRCKDFSGDLSISWFSKNQPYWSSTQDHSGSSEHDVQHALSVSFATGDIQSQLMTESLSVRTILVC